MDEVQQAKSRIWLGLDGIGYLRVGRGVNNDKNSQMQECKKTKYSVRNNQDVRRIELWWRHQIIPQPPPKSVTREKSIGFRGEVTEDRNESRRFEKLLFSFLILTLIFDSNIDSKTSSRDMVGCFHFFSSIYFQKRKCRVIRDGGKRGDKMIN